jgi:non-ribosomal peptide synthetase component F
MLARHLIKHGVGPEARVGLVLMRGLDLVISVIAVLKAGGAYVPLDPGYPEDRLKFIAQDSKPSVLITQAELRHTLANHSVPVITLDVDWPQIELERREQLPCDVGPDNVAYVIYTSGSTGQPKGCEITHANIVRLLTHSDDLFHFDHRDIWTMFHSYAFDFSVWELWGALAYGGKLIVVPFARRSTRYCFQSNTCLILPSDEWGTTANTFAITRFATLDLRRRIVGYK